MFYVFTVVYILYKRLWNENDNCSGSDKTKTTNLLSLFVFLSVNHSKFCFIRSLAVFFQQPLTDLLLHKKIGAAYRLHPFSISLYKALYGVLTAQSSFPTLLPLIPTSCLLRQDNTLSLHIIPYPFYLLLSLSFTLILNCTTDKKMPAVHRLHLFFIAQTKSVFQRQILNNYSSSFSNTF